MSGVTSYDYIVTVSTFFSMIQREFNCSTCKVKYRGYAERQTKHQSRKGCFEAMGKPVMEYLPKHTMKGQSKILYYKCPSLFYDRGVAELIEFHHQWEKGIMPYNGGFMNQPAKFVELMDLVNNLKEENRTDLEEKQRQYGKRSRS